MKNRGRNCVVVVLLWFTLLLSIAYSKAKRVCFHLNDMNYRGSTRAAFDYAINTELLLGHKSIIIYPSESASSIALPLFIKQFNGSVYSYDPDPAQYQVSFGRRLSIGGRFMVKLIESVGCDVLYLMKYGTLDSPPSYPASFETSVPIAVHAVFVYQPHYRANVIPLNSFINPSLGPSASLPHIVSPPRALSSLLISRILSLRRSVGIPDQGPLVMCGFGGADSFDIPDAERATLLLASVYTIQELHFMFMGLAPNFLLHELEESHHDRSMPFTSTWYPNLHVLPPAVDDLSREAFIGSCDAMLHARSIGETFGLAIAEFSIRNKPVLVFNDPTLRADSREHLRILGKKAFLYSNVLDLQAIIADWVQQGVPINDYYAYSEFSPSQVRSCTLSCSHFKVLVI